MGGEIQWLLWVDNEIWGYVDTLQDADWFLTKIAEEISAEIGKMHKKWKVITKNICTDKIKVRCINPGYVYNSKWTVHTVRFEQVFKLHKDPIGTFHIPTPPPPPPILKKKRLGTE